MCVQGLPECIRTGLAGIMCSGLAGMYVYRAGRNVCVQGLPECIRTGLAGIMCSGLAGMYVYRACRNVCVQGLPECMCTGLPCSTVNIKTHTCIIQY